MKYNYDVRAEHRFKNGSVLRNALKQLNKLYTGTQT